MWSPFSGRQRTVRRQGPTANFASLLVTLLFTCSQNNINRSDQEWPRPSEKRRRGLVGPAVDRRAEEASRCS